MYMFKKDKERIVLLKEVIKNHLQEYGIDDGGDYGMGPGVSDDFFKDIWNAFVDPLKTSARFIENFSSEIQRVAGLLSEDVYKMIYPLYIKNYEKHEEKYDERQKAIHDKYKEVLARTEAHLFTGDAALMAFLFAPHEYITGRMMRDAPDTALNIIDMFAGGNKKIKDLTDRAREYTVHMKHWGRMAHGPTSPSPAAIDGVKFPPIKPRWFSPKTSKQTDYSKLMYKKTHTESIDLDENVMKNMLNKVSSLFQDKELKKTIEQSPLAQSMQQDAIEYTQNYVNDFVKMTDETISNLEDPSFLNKSTGNKFAKLFKKVGKDETKKTAQLVVGSSKKGIKNSAIEELTKSMNELPKNAAPLKKVYQNGINVIKSL